MTVSIRPFRKEDIYRKVEWLNKHENNLYLHYELPLDTEKTERWFLKNHDRKDRYDSIIEMDGIPCGLIGLLSIDRINLKAELYIAIGDTTMKGKGISTQACKLLLQYAFAKLGLNRVYLYTETGNLAAQRLFEKIGFLKEGCIRQDVLSHGKYADRFVYGLLKEDYYKTI